MKATSAGQSERGGSYRERETHVVLRAWSTGQSASVIGVGSAGKSNFVRHLASLGQSGMADGWLPVIIDANLLGPLAGRKDDQGTALAYWAGCELLLHRTFMALYPFEEFSAEERTTIYEAYDALQDGSNPLHAMLALRYLELGLSVALRKGIRLAFLFDEFEHLAACLPSAFFQSLRGLRDLYKRQLAYGTASRSTLEVVMAAAGHDPQSTESFVELFSDQVVYLGPLARADGERMIADLLGRRGASLGAPTTNTLLLVTGAHPGLLRAALHAALDQPELLRLPVSELCPTLLLVAAVESECVAIWNGLTEPERVALIHTGTNDEPERSALVLLQAKGLLTPRGKIAPPVFAQFVTRQAVS